MCRFVYDGTSSPEAGSLLNCTKKYTIYTKELICCYDTESISAEAVNLVTLDCAWTHITAIPDTLINLVYLNCNWTLITKLPDTLVNLVDLNCK